VSTNNIPEAGDTVTIKRIKYTVVVSGREFSKLFPVAAERGSVGYAMLRRPRGRELTFAWIHKSGSLHC